MAAIESNPDLAKLRNRGRFSLRAGLDVSMMARDLCEYASIEEIDPMLTGEAIADLKREGLITL